MEPIPKLIARVRFQAVVIGAADGLDGEGADAGAGRRRYVGVAMGPIAVAAATLQS